MNKRGLGRGLGALLGPESERRRRPRRRSRFRSTASSQIRSSPASVSSRRRSAELADSIRASGVIQPIIVRRSGDGYELDCRRATLAGRKAGRTDDDSRCRPRSDQRREPRARPRREPPPRGSEPDGRRRGISSAARGVRLDPGAAWPADRQGPELDRERAAALAAPGAHPGGPPQPAGSRWDTRCRCCP